MVIDAVGRRAFTESPLLRPGTSRSPTTTRMT
jgi:hypothetical protein